MAEDDLVARLRLESDDYEHPLNPSRNLGTMRLLRDAADRLAALEALMPDFTQWVTNQQIHECGCPACGSADSKHADDCWLRDLLALKGTHS